MKKIVLPDHFNYCSAFLTFACTFKCDYCINKYNGLFKYKTMPVKDWITGLNRIQTRKDLPVTLTGGEPTAYKGFYNLVAGIDKEINIDLLTNGDFSIIKFMREISPDRMKRKAKYASIRFSYHPGHSDAQRLFWDVRAMQVSGYSVGIWAVDTPGTNLEHLKEMAETLEIDFRIKEFLDSTHGNYKYPKGVDGIRKKALCKGSEFLIAPNGELFRCHHDLYNRVNPYGHILDSEVKPPTDFLLCENFGCCNLCDQKIKFSRHQVMGHCAVEIKEIHEKQN